MLGALSAGVEWKGQLLRLLARSDRETRRVIGYSTFPLHCAKPLYLSMSSRLFSLRLASPRTAIPALQQRPSFIRGYPSYD